MNSAEIDLKSTTSDSMKDDPTDMVVTFENASFAWLPSTLCPVLKNVNLQLPKQKLIAITGSVASGKSSLLSAMLGEMIKLEGDVHIYGKVAYVPQQAWVRNATIRDNVVLNKSFDDKTYHKILKACALNYDLSMFAAGDMTEVGEKGVNLSGGQKQRISIARALYSNSDIYIFDDPLRLVPIYS